MQFLDIFDLIDQGGRVYRALPPDLQAVADDGVAARAEERAHAERAARDARALVQARADREAEAFDRAYLAGRYNALSAPTRWDAMAAVGLLGLVTGIGLLVFLERPAEAMPDEKPLTGPGEGHADFDVPTSGLHFQNHWPDSTFAGISFPGLCGGMTFTVLDYLAAGRSAPAQTTHPTVDDPLGSYIHGRQFDSLDGPNLLRFGALLANPDDQHVANVTDAEFQTLRSYIDAGIVAPLGLIVSPWTVHVSHAHQVLATGYKVDEDGTRRVYIWDSNRPNQKDVSIVQRPGSTLWREEATKDDWRGFFVEDYTPKTPPNV